MNRGFATDDRDHTTVIDLVPEKLRRDGLFPAGRLDGDTVGFVLITDDGDFAHEILSPKNHIMKTYHATLHHALTNEDIVRFKEGLTLGDGTECLEAHVRMLPDRVNVLYLYPRSAIPLAYAFIFWAFYFITMGTVISGIVFSCEKFKRSRALKIAFLLTVAYACSLCAYPLFFRAMMPLIAFFMLLISVLFCIFAILDSVKLYSLWSICIFFIILWLSYNSFVALAFAFIN